MHTTDVVIVGGGIVGLATAWQLSQRSPSTRITLIEKEREVAQHQTGHNSGVLHSGIYYRPGSLRAENCRLGKLAMQHFCSKEGLPFELCGKVIVAVEARELPQLETILDRGRQNGVVCEKIGPERLHELEPHAQGIAAIHVPEAGIVNYGAVARRLAQRIREAGHEVLMNSKVVGIFRRNDRIITETHSGDVEAKLIVNCGGLHSDHLAQLSGHPPQARIVPFRGEYYELKPAARGLCRTLIYPVPDPNFPFLGVHFTRTIDGGVECGPNAVLTWAREGYEKGSFNLSDAIETLTFPGLWKMGYRNWRAGLAELWRSWSKTAFVNSLRRLVPEVTADDLITAPAGVRAQALGYDGKLVDDFLIIDGDGVINVCNAPSPAATASLNIGAIITDKIISRLA